MLDRYKPHRGPTHGFTDGFRIRGIRLIRLHLRFYELWRHEFYRMSLRPPLSRPIVRASTSLHANQAGRLLRKKRQYLIAPQPFSNNGLASLINPMYLEHVLRQIDTNCCNLHLGRRSRLVGIHIHHCGT